MWLDDHEFFQNINKKCMLDDCYTKFFPKTVFKYKLQQQLKTA